MTIKITNGEVQIKSICTRKLRKKINNALYEGVEIKTAGDETRPTRLGGFSPGSLDRANDVAMLGMIEKITIGGEDKPVTIETLDGMDTKDIDLIIDVIDKITKKKAPKE